MQHEESSYKNIAMGQKWNITTAPKFLKAHRENSNESKLSLHSKC